MIDIYVLVHIFLYLIADVINSALLSTTEDVSTNEKSPSEALPGIFQQSFIMQQTQQPNSTFGMINWPTYFILFLVFRNLCLNYWFDQKYILWSSNIIHELCNFSFFLSMYLFNIHYRWCQFGRSHANIESRRFNGYHWYDFRNKFNLLYSVSTIHDCMILSKCRFITWH